MNLVWLFQLIEYLKRQGALIPKLQTMVFPRQQILAQHPLPLNSLYTLQVRSAASMTDVPQYHTNSVPTITNRLHGRDSAMTGGFYNSVANCHITTGKYSTGVLKQSSRSTR